MELTPQNNLGQHHAVGYLVDASSKSGGRRAIQPGVAENLVRASTGRDSYLGLRGNAGGASAQKKSVYNPLNRHGNAFAGIDQKTDWTRPGVTRDVASLAEPVSARYRKQPECDRGGDDGYESDMEWDKSADYLPPFPSRRGASDEVDFVEGARIRADDHSLYAPVFAAVELGPSKR